MANNISSHLPHIELRTPPLSERFTTPQSARSSVSLPARNRAEHGARLKEELQRASEQAEEIIAARKDITPVERGIYIEFESDPGFSLQLDSLDNRRSGIELVAVSHIEPSEGQQDVVKATVFVREGRLEVFLKKIEQYLQEETKKGTPRNKPLIESISEIRLATIRALWTDASPFPALDQPIWWEAWLRVGDSQEDRIRILEAFQQETARVNLSLSANYLAFPESTVVLVRGSANQLSESVFLLNTLAELRRARELATFFIDMPQLEQADWVEEAVSRITPPSDDAPALCLLDTGVNNEHPLLIVGLDSADMTSYNAAWGVADHDGHGTEMAGLGLHGELTELLTAVGNVELRHRLESVKILPPEGANEPNLYGQITAECTARAEVMAPQRERVFCLTVTTTEFRDRGQPSSWSAAIDQIASGAQEEEPNPKRLLFISAGNTEYDRRVFYPDSNSTDGIHDPAQAWNALTVGAYTDKVSLDPERDPESVPLAPRGGLCPASTTSMEWDGQWPLKPDIVLEGGNMATHPSYTGPYEHEALRLLTTNRDFLAQLLTVTGDTSAATALAARMGAIVLAEYPQFWPETIRGLLVHSAEWTSAMVNATALLTRTEIENVLRTFGYGVPVLESALYSARDSLTLIAQNEIQPFLREGSAIKTNEMHLYELPWPSEILTEYPDTICEMRVTLSYFVEPNPTRRGFTTKYRYASHGLRFDVRTPTETPDVFRRRVNQVARAEVEDFQGASGDAPNWVLGPTLRTRGSIHSDIWRGTAADLASKGYIAVYPITGWWKELKRQQRWDSVARYSLIVTIRTQDVTTDIDLYTPVMNLVVV
jgi:hypothetical protein